MSEMRVRLATPSLKAVVRLVAIIVACAIALYLFWSVRSVVRLVGIALFLALTLNPLVDSLDTRIRVPRAAIIVAIYLVLITFVVVVGTALVPSLVRQVHHLSSNAPTYLHDLRQNSTFRHYDDRYHITAALTRQASELPSRLQHSTGSLQTATVRVFAVVGNFLTVMTIAFLLMLRGRDYVGMALRLTGKQEQRYRNLVLQVNQAVASYMLGNVAISVLCTVSSWIVLMLLGVPYALSLAIVMGFLDLIPLVGATLGAILVGIATATVDFPTATIVWVIFSIVYQRIENDMIQPVVYGRALNVNPLVTIISVLVGARLLGILGALLAIPIAAAIQILLRDWWSNRSAGASSATMEGARWTPNPPNSHAATSTGGGAGAPI
jgi:predicted PurR-regulated permease PerM